MLRVEAGLESTRCPGPKELLWVSRQRDPRLAAKVARRETWVAFQQAVDRRTMHILGISAYYHDSAACRVRDGEILAAAQEERFTRQKHDASFPQNAVDFCLREAGI